MTNLVILSALVSVVSMILSLCAVLIAWSSLRQAKQVAERERGDWRQRTWFDLYAKVDEAYDLLDHFQTQYRSQPPSPDNGEQVRDWNNLMCHIRGAYRRAVVFPKNPAADELFACTKFKNPAEAMSKERLQRLLDAGENLRQRALIKDTSILDEDTGSICR